MATIDAILFDLDGTLLDTAPEFTACLNQLLREEGKAEVTLSALRSTVSFGANGMISLGFGLPQTDPAFTTLKQRLLDIYREKLGFKTHLFPGLTDVLATLAAHRIPWGIVTNKPKAYSVPLVKQFSPLNASRCVISGDTLATKKPDPAPLLHACQTLGVTPSHCWYIGDALADIQAARSAGMRSAVANYGYIPTDTDPLDWQADCYLPTPIDIARLI